MLNKKMILFVSALSLAAFAIAQNSLVELRADMSGSGIASGKAKYKLKQRAGRQLQEEIEVEGEDLAPNSTYTITLSGAPIGEATTDGFGSFEWSRRNLRTRGYQVQAGTPVGVEDANGPVMSGAFAPL